MRIAIASMDSRGGVQPYVGLALGLKAAGHDVRLIGPSGFEGMLADAGVDHVPLSGDVEAGAKRLGSSAHGSPLAGMRAAAREMEHWTAIHTREAYEGCRGQDLVLGGIGGMAVALSAAEKAGVPFLEAHLQPVGVATDRYQGVLFGSTPRVLGGPGRRLSHRLTELGIWMPIGGGMKRARREVLGLSGSPKAHLANPVLYGFSRHVVPLPEGGPRPRHVTGYWFLPGDPGRTLPADLEAFLATGGPVVSIGFGSMASEDGESLTQLVVGAVRDAGVRAVLLSGWGGTRRAWCRGRRLCRRRAAARHPLPEDDSGGPPRRCGDNGGGHPGGCPLARGAVRRRPAVLGFPRDRPGGRSAADPAQGPDPGATRGRVAGGGRGPAHCDSGCGARGARPGRGRRGRGRHRDRAVRLEAALTLTVG